MTHDPGAPAAVSVPDTADAPLWWLMLGRDRRLLPPRVIGIFVDQLYALRASVIVASTMTAGLVGGFAARQTGDPVLTVLVALACLLTLTWLPLVRAYRRAGVRLDDRRAVARWEVAFAAHSFMGTFALGLVVARGLTATEDASVRLVVAVVALASIYSVLRNSVRLPIVVLRLAGSCGPLVVASVLEGDRASMILAGGSVALAYNMLEMARNYYRSEVATRIKDIQLQAYNRQFQVALDNMRHGLCMIDADERVLVCNRRFLEMFGFSAEVVHSGVSLRDLARHSVECGNHPGYTAEELYRQTVAFFADGLADSTVEEIGGGRTIAVSHQRMATGGWVATFEDITERLAAEVALRESEEHYRHRVEFDPRCNWTADTEGRILEMSSFWSAYTGLATEAALGRGWLRPIHPDDREATTAAFMQARDTGTPVEVRHRYRNAAGEYRWWLSSAFPRRDEAGCVVKWYGYAADIHERTVAEQQLRESERRLATLIANLPGMAYRCEPERPWMINYASEGAEALTGYACAAFTEGQLVWSDITHPDDIAAVQQAVDDALRERRQFTIVYRLVHRSGEIRWVLERGQPVFTPSGELMGLEGFIGDISDQKIAEEALRRSEAQLATVFNQAIVGIALSAAGRGIILANERLATLLGRSVEALKGLTIHDLTHPDDLESNLVLFRRHAATGEPLLLEKRYLRPDGSSVWCKVNVSFVAGAPGEPRLTVLMVEDISEKREAEAQLQKLQAELIHVSRVSAMGAMGTAVAHELNQPLAAIANYAAAVRLQVGQSAAPEPLREAVERLTNETLRAAQIIKRLRSLVAKGEASVAREDLAELIREANVLALVGAREADVTCRLELEPGLVVTADKVQVQQVLVNLVRNAVEAMAATDRRELLIATARVGGEARISVSDTGPGLPPSVEANLFAPFTTTKTGGMGVGLSICRTIVDAHRGRIWADSTPGRGACFCFTLPAEPESDVERKALVGSLEA